MSAMSLLIEYFAASSDEQASALIDGGGPVAAGSPAVSGDGIEPVVLMGVLEELLTSRSYDEIAAAAEPIVAERDGGERLIVRLTDSLTRALAEADAERVAAVAGAVVAGGGVLRRRRPRTARRFPVCAGRPRTPGDRDGGHLYCWVVV